MHDEMARVAEALPGFKADAVAVQLWLSRMRGSVDWKERQADAVVRRHKWERAHLDHKTALKTNCPPSVAKGNEMEKEDEKGLLMSPSPPTGDAYVVSEDRTGELRSNLFDGAKDTTMVDVDGSGQNAVEDAHDTPEPPEVGAPIRTQRW
jgi:hypothetical protein